MTQVETKKVEREVGDHGAREAAELASRPDRVRRSDEFEILKLVCSRLTVLATSNPSIALAGPPREWQTMGGRTRSGRQAEIDGTRLRSSLASSDVETLVLYRFAQLPTTPPGTDRSAPKSTPSLAAFAEPFFSR